MTDSGEAMSKATIVGIDLAKWVFALRGVSRALAPSLTTQNMIRHGLRLSIYSRVGLSHVRRKL